jgi:hypothetical protein
MLNILPELQRGIAMVFKDSNTEGYLALNKHDTLS